MATAYKLFRLRKGKLYPMYVCANEEVPVGVWLEAKEGERLPTGKVKARLGKGLSYRPGWHCADIPLTTHIGKKDADGNIVSMHDDTVWAEVEYADGKNYEMEAFIRGMNHKTHNHNPQKACLDYIPVGGFYRYKTNPHMLADWIITGSIRVKRILSDEEVADICIAHGFLPQRRSAS